MVGRELLTMWLTRLSIAWKITLLAGLCLALIVTLLVVASLQQTQRSSALVKEASSSILEAAVSERVSAYGPPRALLARRMFMDIYPYGAGILGQVRLVGEQSQARMGSAFDLREDLIRLTRSALDGNPQLYGLY